MTPASIGGIRFYIDSDQTEEFGRANQLHQPYAESHTILQDTGGHGRKFMLQGFLSGDDYDIERDRLRRLFETEGPYSLVHPYFGRIYVANEGPVTGRQSPKYGGIYEFSVTVMEVGDPSFIVPQAASARDLVRAAKVVFVRRFANNYKKPNGNFFMRVRAALFAVSTQLLSINGKIGAISVAADDFSAGIDGLKKQLDTLINSPAALASALSGVILSIFDLLGDVFRTTQRIPGIATNPLGSLSATAVSAVSTLMDTSSAEFKPGQKLKKKTPDAIAVDRSLDELDNFIRAAAIQACCDFLIDPATKYASANEAEDARDRLVILIDRFILTTFLDADSTASLLSIKSAMYRHLSLVAERLPRLYVYTPEFKTNALVVAYGLYGNLDRVDEIIARNKIFTPLKILGGTPLEVLSDGKI